MQIKLYITAKLEHAPRLARMQADGFHINARWIHMQEQARQRQVPVSHWKDENRDDIIAAHYFMLFTRPEDELKGSIEEIGFANAYRKKIWIAGDAVDINDEKWGVLVKPDGAENEIRVPHKKVVPWGFDRGRIRMVPNMQIAMMEMKALAKQDRILNSEGAELPKFSF